MNDMEMARKLMAFEEERARVAALARQLDAVPRWLPARGLREVVSRTGSILDHARARFDAKPVVAVVGPTGSGKSTLVNALAGRDGLVGTGHDRPTTRDVAVIARTVGDGRQLMDQIAHEHVSVVPCAATPLRDVILVDTPDTDSAECLDHRPLLERALQMADVLLCVFDVSNPKRRDNLLALADWVNTFPGEQVFLVLNRCDRVRADDLDTLIVPDFLEHVSRSWARKHDEVFLVSARSSLEKPDWPEGERPLHERNQVGGLRDRLRALGGGAFFADRRVERARHLRRCAEQVVRETVGLRAPGLPGVREDLASVEHEVAREIVDAVSRRATEDSGGLSALLCGALAPRWWGPVGMFVGLWRRTVDFGTPLRMLRSLNPSRLARALGRALRALKDPGGFEQELETGLGRGVSESECIGARIRIAQQWPDLAERLVGNGFDPVVRERAATFDLEPLLNLSQHAWEDAMRRAVDDTADRLSRPALMWALNAPTLLGLAWAGYILVESFLRQNFLPANFFLHVGAVIALLWLMPAWLLQVRAQRSRAQIPRRALAHALAMTRDGLKAGDLGRAGMGAEVDRVLALGRPGPTPTDPPSA